MNTSVLHKSPLDSQRFGLNVMRGQTHDPDVSALCREIITSACDIAIIRVPTGTALDIGRFARMAMPAIHADTLVYYTCDLTRHVPSPLRNTELEFALATPADLAELRALIAYTFARYVSHYHANPMFPREQVLAGYQQWAEGHVGHERRSLWTARRDGRIVAFAACEQDKDSGDAEGVLYGVGPDAAGGGIYSDLIRYTQQVARRQGARSMKVSTQVGNFAVQKVWAREGFHMFRALDTLHINALLSTGDTVADRCLTFSAEQIGRFAAATGDTNPIHVDARHARLAGFAGPIAHGVMTAAEFSRVLGTEAPGPGTVITHLDLVFLRPVIADTEYRLVVRIPGSAREGPMRIVATVTDCERQPCLIAYADVVRRAVA